MNSLNFSSSLFLNFRFWWVPLLLLQLTPRGFAQAELVDLVDFTVVSVSECDAQGMVEVTADVTLSNASIRSFSVEAGFSRFVQTTWTGNPTRVTFPLLANDPVQEIEVFSSSLGFDVSTNITVAVCPNACRIDSVSAVAVGPCDASGRVEATFDVAYTNPNSATGLFVAVSRAGEGDIRVDRESATGVDAGPRRRAFAVADIRAARRGGGI